MRGKRRPRPRSRLRRLVLLLAAGLLVLQASPAAARELRRQMPFLRPLLMGDAYTAVGDESSGLFYNPAGLARVHDSSVEALSVQFAADRILTRLLLEPDEVRSEYEGLSPQGLDDIIGTSLFADLQLRLPFVVDAGQGIAYGLGVESLAAIEVVQDEFGLPALQVEAFLDETAFYSTFGSIGGLSLGLTGKVVNRAGLDKRIDALTLFALGPELNLDNDPDFKALSEGETRLRAGADFGFIYELPGFPDWHPRFGLAVLNYGGRNELLGYHGIEFGQRVDKDTPPTYGRLPLSVNAGFALSPTYNAIRYTFAFDVVDLAKTAIEGDSVNNRTRIGFEIGIGPHDDGTALFSVLFGWNATHFSVGVLSRVWIFEIGMGRYTVEKGPNPGANPEDRRVLLIAFRF